jgi:L-rhamnose-H+ transport protein
MHDLLPALMVVALASCFQGTFGLGMKYIRPLAWEAWWLVYTVVAMLLLPILCAFLLVPHVFRLLAYAPTPVLLKSAGFGFLWGVGGILFGKCVERIGVALTYGIVMGLAASVGSIVPLMGQQELSHKAVLWVLVGNLIMLAGVALSAWAGVRRDRLIHHDRSTSGADSFMIGLSMAILCGLLSALLNVGFVSAQPIATVVAARGVSHQNANLAAWVVVLFGAFLMNAAYAAVLLLKNRTTRTLTVCGAWTGWKWALASGALWFAALATYGYGAAMMGRLGPVVGWPLLLGLALILSNLLALRAGEWQGASKALRYMCVALIVLLTACCCLGYSNRMLQF